MALQKTILNAIKRNGKPATVTWQASTALDQRAPKKGTVETYAYEATVKVVTQSGATAYEKRIYLPVLGSGLTDQSQKMTVAARAMAEKKALGHRS